MNATTTCFTFSPPKPGQAAWAPSPSCRGTFDIITLCLSTVVICIWSAIHWDIPLERLDVGLPVVHGWRIRDIGKRLKRRAIIICRFFKQRGPLVLVATFLPALLLFRAINQFFDAWKLVKAVSRPMKRKALDEKECGDGVEPKQIEGDIMHSKDYSSSVEQHGPEGPDVALPNSASTLEQPRNEPRQKIDAQGIVERFEFTFVHAFYAIMGGYAFTVVDDHRNLVLPDFLPPEQKRAKLTAEGIQFLVKYDPNVLPDLPRWSISEKAKSNTLGKAIMSVQVLWFCLNCLSRLVEDVPLSLLEVSTLAHGFCTLLSCAVWWRKPLNVDSPTWMQIDSPEAQAPLALMLIVDHQYGSSDMNLEEEFENVRRALKGESYSGPPTARLTCAIKAATRYGLSSEDVLVMEPGYLSLDSSPGFRDLFGAFALRRLDIFVVFSVTTPIVYGSLHILGWFTQFPTTTERILWRIATVATMSPGITAAVSFMLLDPIYQRTEYLSLAEKFAERSKKAIASFIIPFIYSLASMYLLFESVRQLWYLSPDAYKVASWSYYVPHLF